MSIGDTENDSSIDGHSIDEVTIDGEQVYEITQDGDVVFTVYFEGKLDLADYTDTDGTGNHHWRGYVFEPSQQLSVGWLYGGYDGSTDDEWNIGLYEWDGEKPTTRLASRKAVNSRFAPHEINDDDVVLSAGQQYLLAQGRDDDQSGSHYKVDSFDPDEILADFPFESWEPIGGDECFRWNNGDEEFVIDEGDDYDLNSNMPHLGIEFTL